MLKSLYKRVQGLDRGVVATLAAVFLIGGFVGGLVVQYTGLASAATPTSHSLRLSDPDHKLISPLLLADSGRPGDKDIEDKLKVETYDLLNLPNMKNISIYFRDLKSGIWAGVGESTEYDPASLLKVPIMIAWFKDAESDPSVLRQLIVYQGSVDGVREETQLVVGVSYTAEELIRLMVEKSDNGAKDLLLTHLDPKTIDSVFTDLGIETWGTGDTGSEHISPIIYSRFLRILYNASYLDRDYSERALDLLSSTDFNTGIVAGVPEGTVVAHKFGEYEDPGQTIAELHDCGIVYHPTNPYLLCVMTRGTAEVDVHDLEKVLKTTSQAMYDIVDQDLAKRG